MTNTTGDNRLLNALQNPAAFDHPVDSIRVIETHISWVLLTGDYAYKIKKPIELGFLDFSTLEKRCFFCQEELRLNRRLAPQLYLEVVAITGEPERPRLKGTGPAIEYAVKMKQFADDALLEHLIEQDQLTPAHIDHLAHTIASFHSHTPAATTDDGYGVPEDVQTTAEQNFRHILVFLKDPVQKSQIDALNVWCGNAFNRCRGTMQQRKKQGFIRECHGDLHLDNIVLLDGRPTPFDCIEFSKTIRWIDVISEVAFIVMDLEAKSHRSLAYRLLNRYLEISGDYAGLRLLRYYLVYRAMVRATVDTLKLAQMAPSQQKDSPLALQYQQYVNLAQAYTQTDRSGIPVLIITHGFSGSGKSVLAAQLAEPLAAIRLRSDIERKRLTGHAPQARSDSGIHAGLYTGDISVAVYRHLHDTAAQLLDDRLSVIIDATFLKKPDRVACQRLARQLGAAFVILDLQAPFARLRERILKRYQQRTDPSEASLEVLKYQINNNDPLNEPEQAYVIRINTDRNTAIDTIVDTIAQRRKEAARDSRSSQQQA